MTQVRFLLLFIAFTLFSCSEKSIQNNEPLERQDAAYQTFNKAKEEPEVDKKLDLLALANKQIRSPEDTLFFDILDYQIYYHNVQKAHDSSMHYANLMIDQAEKLNDTASLAKGYYRKARNFLYAEEHEKVLKNMYKSQNLYKAIKDSAKAGRRLVELANAQDRLGDFTGGQQSATEALKFLPENDSVYRSSAHNVIALTSSKLKDFESAIKEFQNALRYTTSTQESLTINNNIALNYRYNSNFKRSNEIFLESLQKSDSGSITALRLANNYYYNQFLESSKNVAPKLEKIKDQRLQIDDKEGVMASYNYLANVYRKTNPDLALKMSENYLSASREFGNVLGELEALRILIDLQDGRDQNKYASRYFALNDSINDARTKIKNIFAKIRFDEEQKIKRIENLELLSAERKLALAGERSQKLVILLVLIILILIAVFMFYLVKQKHKKDKILEVYATEARLSKRVHDELANDLFLIMTELELSSSDSHIINRLESAYQRTRNISKENSPINTGEDFPNELRGMINGTIQSDAKTVIQGFANINWSDYKKEQKIVIYRTIQELLVNFRKHSNANILVLKFEEEKSKLKITYKDNGMGADLKQKTFSGLRNMENRTASVGGSITFQSEINNGFSSTIYIPI